MRDILYTFAGQMGAALGFERVAMAGNVLGNTLWSVLRARREYASDAIARHLEVGKGEAERIAQESFRHNCRSFMEIMLTRQVDWRFVQERLTFDRPDLAERIQRDDRPAVMVTGHMGAWEVYVGLMHMLMPREEKAVVVRSARENQLNRFMLRQRTRPTVRIVEHRQAAFPVLRILRKQGAVAFLVDHNCSRDEAVFLPFLGRQAAVNIGPALLALRAGARIWPTVLVRTEDGGYHLHNDEPLDTRDMEGDRQERIEQVAAFYTQAMERYVRMYPEQWFWMHKRWKTRPPEE